MHYKFKLGSSGFESSYKPIIKLKAVIGATKANKWLSSGATTKKIRSQHSLFDNWNMYTANVLFCCQIQVDGRQTSTRQAHLAWESEIVDFQPAIYPQKYLCESVSAQRFKWEREKERDRLRDIILVRDGRVYFIENAEVVYYVRVFFSGEAQKIEEKRL